MLRVLVQNRADARSHPGGDTVQMDWTVRFLRERGHAVSVSFESAPDLGDVDLVHLFNLTRPEQTLVQADNARRHSTPYVLSSIYWDLDAAVPWHAYEFPRNLWRRVVPPGLRRWVRSLRTGGRAASGDAARLQSAVLRDARLVFPNSEAEKAHLLSRFDVLPPDRYRVVRNGVETPASSRLHETEQASPAQGNRRDGGASRPDPRGAFVCAGAIGPRKNQLNLVKAFRRLPDERLLIIGRPSPGSDRYARAARRAAGANVSFHDAVPHADMSRVLGAARACAQPSFIETPGLTAMEAAAAGLPIVAADVAPVREYFGDVAQYCEPDSPESIARACRAAARRGRTDGETFAARHDWRVVLRPLGEAYAELEAVLHGIPG